MVKVSSKASLIILDLTLVAGLMTTSIAFLIIFYTAMVVNETGRVLLDVNSLDEGWMEMSAFVIFLVSAVYKFNLICDDYKRGKT